MRKQCPPLSPVTEPVPLPDKAYSAIRAAILSFQLEPGAPLVEKDLASQLGISKIPLREALHQLENDGLVTRVPYKGVYVSRLTTKEAAELAIIRGALEGLAAFLATPRMTQDEIDRAGAILDEATSALRAGDLMLCDAKGREFHDLIIAKSDNSTLITILENLDVRFHRFRILSNQIRGRTTQSLQEHQRVLRALQCRDAVAAEHALREHLTSVGIDLEKEAK